MHTVCTRCRHTDKHTVCSGHTDMHVIVKNSSITRCRRTLICISDTDVICTEMQLISIRVCTLVCVGVCVHTCVLCMHIRLPTNHE
jgi:hypothetical protein